jgi:hypothetical protein
MLTRTGRSFLAGILGEARANSGPMTMLARYLAVVREEKQMYLGGGVVGIVVIVLIVLFLVGRI